MTDNQAALFTEARKRFHASLLSSNVLRIDDRGIASNADSSNRPSTNIANSIVHKLGAQVAGARLAGQTSGNKFEGFCATFLRETFLNLAHLRPGAWSVLCERLAISQYEQYAHLVSLRQAAKTDRHLAAALASDYTVSPDIVITRDLEPDEAINAPAFLVDEQYARSTSLRKINGGYPLLHASISCKWTIRSDRAQNSRLEALNLIRNRKGRLPHIVVVTGEPLPSRLASIALGTGDIDCVYHFALNELISSVRELGYEDAEELLSIMVDGKRLKDISDLPLDLAV